MATAAKKSGLTAVKNSKPAPAARRRRGSPEKTERNAAIVAAVRAGASRIAVAAEHGITRERVNVILKNAAKASPVSHKERNAAIAAAAFAGEPHIDIAKRFGISDARVSQIAQAADSSYRGRRATRRAAIAADLGTLTVKEIAEKNGVSEDYVKTIRRLDGGPSPRIADKAAIVADAATMTTKEIAAKHGISIDYVQTIRRLAGVAASPGKAAAASRRRRKVKLARGEMTKRIVALAPTHTCRQIADIIGGIGPKYVRNTLARRGLKAVRSDFSAVPQQLRAWVSTPPSVPEIAAAAVATELASLPGRPSTDVHVEVKPRRRGDDYSIAELRKAFPEFEIPAPQHVGDFALISRPAPAAPVDVFVKPSAVYVAEVVARHGLDVARERWPFLAFDELCELNRQGAALISPPADEPLQPLGVRLWRAVKRLFGRS